METALVLGHRIGDRVYEFPHFCPGPACAIAAWLERKEKTMSLDDTPHWAAITIQLLDSGPDNKKR